jgi:hypothetical protein
MTVLALAAKAMLAVLLIGAGGAKLADIAGFAAAVAMFVPLHAPRRMRSLVPVAAAAVIGAELLVGLASLCWPSATWADLAVLALAGAFTVVATVGYARFRDRPCRCFGALTRRSFSARSLVQSIVILAVAALAALRPPGQAAVSVGFLTHLLLFAAAALLVVAARTAAKALATSEVAA